MSVGTMKDLKSKRCVPCEGGVPPIAREEALRLLKDLPNWSLSENKEQIRREFKTADFLAAIDFFIRVSKVAEDEGHHPDLHLTDYSRVTIELSTHAIGGLSENDFIMAARIDELPVEA